MQIQQKLIGVNLTRYCTFAKRVPYMRITLEILLSRAFGWWRSRGTRLNIATTSLSSLEILPSCWCPTTFHITIVRDAWCHLLRREGTSGTMNMCSHGFLGKQQESIPRKRTSLLFSLLLHVSWCKLAAAIIYSGDQITDRDAPCTRSQRGKTDAESSWMHVGLRSLPLISAIMYVCASPRRMHHNF